MGMDSGVDFGWMSASSMKDAPDVCADNALIRRHESGDAGRLSVVGQCGIYGTAGHSGTAWHLRRSLVFPSGCPSLAKHLLPAVVAAIQRYGAFVLGNGRFDVSGKAQRVS